MTSGHSLNILVTTPQWQAALACIQSLGRRGHKMFVWGKLDDHPNLQSSFVHRKLARSPGNIESQVLELESIISEHAIDFVIPISDSDVLIGAKLNEKLQRAVCFAGTVDAVMTARDRNRTAELCRAAGLPLPKSVAATTLTAERLADEIGYPCFIKLSGTVASQGVMRVASKSEIGKHLAKIPHGLTFQIQKEIVGYFAGVTGVAGNGVLFDSCFSFEMDYKHSRGGAPPYVQECHDSVLVDILGKVARALDWTGGLDLDLLRDVHGNYYILEINPRLSGTAVFPYKLGIDLPSLFLKIHSGEQAIPRPVPDVADGQQEKAQRRFVSILTEARYLQNATSDQLSFAKRFREGDLWFDNSFPDDPGYTRSLREHTQQIPAGQTVH